ncbi:F-box/kelch-repeat protein [Vitis vinifera]|uniref:F-box/kelch-repeat protein n=1 Tax=Vitis vinifera TaxID=29760 RepID=A0A438K4F2_VITVI|nr:F-box/kelch-repeat protein [Vitis vinifera]
MISERLSGETSLRRDLEALSVSQRLVRSVSQKLRKKNNRSEGEEEEDGRGVSLRCLVLYGRGGGCKVGAETSDDFGDPVVEGGQVPVMTGKGTKQYVEWRKLEWIASHMG